MGQALATSDPTYAPKTQHNALDSWALKYVKDPRDLPFMHLILQIAAVQIPFAIVLFALGDFEWWLGAIYLAVVGAGFLDRFILMLHNTSHRRLFKKHVMWANRIIPWVLGPFFGETPGTYFAHHVGMHHPENNLEDDLSTTMPFRRDRFFHFMRYFTRFFFLGIIELALYHKKRNRPAFLKMAVVGELSYYAVVIALMIVRPEATLVVFVIPVVLVRFLMMAGNWGQHAFIVAEDPGNPYLNSITCINSRYNRRCFNDGYHIGHHVKATRHWTEMPVEFNEMREEYARQGAIVFEGIDFFMVWAALMTKRWNYLAKRMVTLGDEPSDIPSRIALLKSRVHPIVREV
ncbi:MAG: fatty acid desaturase [Myxococcota bacterium]|jgi:fatty acid desaturase